MTFKAKLKDQLGHIGLSLLYFIVGGAWSAVVHGFSHEGTDAYNHKHKKECLPEGFNLFDLFFRIFFYNLHFFNPEFSISGVWNGSISLASNSHLRYFTLSRSIELK